jgi:7tm Odorant receptor
MANKNTIIQTLSSKFFKYSVESDSREIFVRIIEFIRKELDLVGQNVMSEDYSPTNIKAKIFYCICAIFSFNKIDNFILQSQSTYVMLENLMYISIIAHFILKCVVFNAYHRNSFEAVSMIEDYHKRTVKLSPEHSKKLKEWTFNISCIVLAIFLFFASLGFINLIFICTLYQYNFTFFILITFLVLALHMYPVILSCIMIFVSHMFVQYKSLMISVEQLNCLIQINSDNSNDEEIKSKIAVIVEAQNDLSNYLKVFSQVFSPVYLVEFLTVIPNVAALLTRISMNLTIYSDYFGLMMCLFGVFFSCLLGSLLEVQHDKYFAALCNISWVDLSVKQRNSLCMMLLASMKTKCIPCGIWNYNLEMFVSLCHSAYSYFNILLSLRT